MSPTGRWPPILMRFPALIALATPWAVPIGSAIAQPVSVTVQQCIAQTTPGCVLELARQSAPGDYGEDPQLLLAMARAARAAGDSAASNADYQRAAAMADPKQLPTSDFSRFVGYFVDFHIAIGNLARAEQLAMYTPYDTTRAYRLIEIYSIYENLGQTENAAAVLERIGQIQKIIAPRKADHANVSLRLALALAETGKRDDARALLRPLLAEHDAAQAPGLAAVLSATGDHQGAATLARAISKPQLEARAQAHIATRAGQQGAMDIAEAALTRALQLAPPGQDSRADLAITEALLALGEFQPAFDRAENAGGGTFARLDRQFALSACIRHIAGKEGPKRALGYLPRLPEDMRGRARLTIIEEALDEKSYTGLGELVEIAAGIEAKRLRLLAYAAIAGRMSSGGAGARNPR